MNGAYFSVGLVARKGSSRDGEGMRAKGGVSEDLAKVEWSVEVDSGRFLQEIVGNGVQGEDAETSQTPLPSFLKKLACCRLCRTTNLSNLY